jgi:hypothetical protein
LNGGCRCRDRAIVGAAAELRRALEPPANAGGADVIECCCGEKLDTGRLLPQEAEKNAVRIAVGNDPDRSPWRRTMKRF